MTRIVTGVFGLLLLNALTLQAKDLPDPVSQPADKSKPVKVFILMGQSNMLGFGKVSGDQEGCLDHAVRNEGLYPFLVDDAGNWIERQDVRNVFTMGSGGPSGRGGAGVDSQELYRQPQSRLGPAAAGQPLL
jgi:hypothetical protein